MENLVDNSSSTLSKDTKEADSDRAEPKRLEINPKKYPDLVLTANGGLNIYRLENGQLGHEKVALLSKPCLRGLADQRLANCMVFSNKLTEAAPGEEKQMAQRQNRDLTGLGGMEFNGKAGGADSAREEPAAVDPASEPALRTKVAPGGCLGGGTNRPFAFLLAPNFLVLSVSFCFLAYGCSTPVVHLVPYALSLGLEHQQAAFLMAMFGVSGIVGNVTFGWIMDRK